MFDATLYYREKARKSVSLETWGLEEKNYGLCTIHRAENTDDENRLISICKALNQINSFADYSPSSSENKKYIKKFRSTSVVKRC